MLQPAPDQRPGRFLDRQSLIDMNKKIIFIDIPGTGGDLVNEFFTDIFDSNQCVVHFEKDPLWSTKEGKSKILSDFDYLSGCISYSQLKIASDLSNFNIFTFLRDPREQIIDYLNFIRSLSGSGSESNLERYPECIKRLSAKLSLVNFSDQDSVDCFVKSLDSEEFSVLDNPQTRYLRSCQSNKSVDFEDVLDAVKTLKSLSAFGLFGRMTSDLKLISNLFGVEQVNYSWPKGVTLAKKTSSNALDVFISFDLNLYKVALKAKGNELLDNLNLDYVCDDFILSVDKVTKKSIHGWMKIKNNIQFDCPVSVFVNGDYAGDFLANGHRKDLKRKFGIDCAFDFFIKNSLTIGSGDWVSFVSSEFGFVIKEIKFD